MLLQVSDIRVHYGTAEVLKSVSLDVDTDAVVSVIGANGAGKTSILKAITGLVPITSGEITFLDTKITALPTHKIAKLGIALVPEGRRPFPHVSVIGNLKLGAYLQKDKANADRVLNEILERFPILWKRRKHQAGTLSGGEQQMLVIGRALMAQPKLLLMDEPSLGLAPIVIGEVQGIIKDINRDGIGVLLVEQNASMVTQLSSKVYVLELGKVILKGNIAELLANDLVQRAFFGTYEANGQ
ncbi:MAG: ABC transporter ATP-binding protein [Desulfobacteraceae bacterium]